MQYTDSTNFYQDYFHKNYKLIRKTGHTHDPLDDVRGIVETLLAMKEMGLGLQLT